MAHNILIFSILVQINNMVNFDNQHPQSFNCKTNLC
jgi:hypothetical protein